MVECLEHFGVSPTMIQFISDSINSNELIIANEWPNACISGNKIRHKFQQMVQEEIIGKRETILGQYTYVIVMSREDLIRIMSTALDEGKFGIHLDFLLGLVSSNGKKITTHAKRSYELKKRDLNKIISEFTERDVLFFQYVYIPGLYAFAATYINHTCRRHDRFLPVLQGIMKSFSNQGTGQMAPVAAPDTDPSDGDIFDNGGFDLFLDIEEIMQFYACDDNTLFPS